MVARYSVSTRSDDTTCPSNFVNEAEANSAERQAVSRKKRSPITRSRVLAVCLICVLPSFSCSGKRPSNLGISDVGLASCSSSPNCVSSDSHEAAHRVEAIALAASRDDAWRVLREEVARLPRTTVVEETANYVRAECASALFGFVDDLELHLRASDSLIAVRSASRVGYSDLGVNRRRVERLREVLRARGIVR